MEWPFGFAVHISRAFFPYFFLNLFTFFFHFSKIFISLESSFVPFSLYIPIFHDFPLLSSPLSLCHLSLMVTADSGDEVIFLHTPLKDLKPNLLTPESFVNTVASSGWATLIFLSISSPLIRCVSLRIPFVVLAKGGNIYFAQVDVSLRFPYYSVLIDLCKYLGVSPTQLTPNALHMWVGLRPFLVFLLCSAKFLSTRPLISN